MRLQLLTLAVPKENAQRSLPSYGSTRDAGATPHLTRVNYSNRVYTAVAPTLHMAGTADERRENNMRAGAEYAQQTQSRCARVPRVDLSRGGHAFTC